MDRITVLNRHSALSINNQRAFITKQPPVCSLWSLLKGASKALRFLKTRPCVAQKHKQALYWLRDQPHAIANVDLTCFPQTTTVHLIRLLLKLAPVLPPKQRLCSQSEIWGSLEQWLFCFF
jgi:hypothetical protein